VEEAANTNLSIKKQEQDGVEDTDGKLLHRCL
jgi:hypothetical protein